MSDYYLSPVLFLNLEIIFVISKTVIINEVIMIDSQICFMTATEIAQGIKGKKFSALEVMDIHIGQVAAINPKVNAIVTFIPELALEKAKIADKQLSNGDSIGPLHGLPVAHKDLFITKGILTTFGSPVFKDHVPSEDALIVKRLKLGGAITIGKTNTPEFGAGSQTFNEVFGRTLNPYDLTKTCGGSSGGAAVALACGMIPIADGSDMGGSLRNPANFCNVVGFRNSLGRVPTLPDAMPWSSVSVPGAMARTVEDVALMLQSIAGQDFRAPTSIREGNEIFAQPLDRSFKGTKIAWSVDMGGLPIDKRVRSVMQSQRSIFSDLGCEIDDAAPDFSDANEIFTTMRAMNFATSRKDLYDNHRDQLKDTIIWNVEEGLKLTALDVGNAEVKRSSLVERVSKFMQTHEFMVFPVSQHPPFDVEQEYLSEVDGNPMETYIDWMRSCYYVTVTGLPSISVPCGFTDDGLPVGVQIVGRHQDDFGVLQLAYAFQEATKFWKRKPSIVE